MILTSLLVGALAFPQAAGAAAPRPERSFRFVYSAAIPEVPAGARTVRLWIPVPLDTPDQVITNLAIEAKAGAGDTLVAGSQKGAKPADLASGSKDGLRWTVGDVGGGFGKSLCIESAGQPVSVELAFDVKRFETRGGGKASPAELAELKQPDAMIPLDGKVAAIAASLKTPSEPMATARALYEHTLERMNYGKPEGVPWGRGDAEWACDAKVGNCTDFHSYFMGLARVKGLAARFEMGFAVPGGAEKEAKVGGYHCWAYVWIDGHGWLPVDISEADKDPSKAEYFFGTLDADRVTMTGGRDLQLTPAPAEGKLNFFVYPYAEVDGKKVDTATRAFKRIDL
ncbi:MAG TPA: transglutaminase-like domain-containing protein [Planctomycetota bacterium]